MRTRVGGRSSHHHQLVGRRPEPTPGYPEGERLLASPAGRATVEGGYGGRDRSQLERLGDATQQVVDWLRRAGKLPRVMVRDGGTESTSGAMRRWAETRALTLHFITPGKPIENAYAESFIGKFRHECLRRHWFEGLADARAKIELWREDYNRVRPHRSLGQQTPEEVLRKYRKNPGLTLGVLSP